MNEERGPLTGRLAFVTGGSRGIGAAVSERLAELGADVVLSYHSHPEEAEAVTARCGRHGGRAVAVPGDIAVPDGPARLVAAVREHGEPDIVVSSAAAPFPRGPLTSLGADVLGRKAQSDVAALHELTTAFVPAMHERGYGRLIVITSGSAQGPTAPGMIAHGVAKSALEGYVRYASDELSHSGVTVNAVAPGFTATDGSSGLPQAMLDALARATPAGRVGTPRDVACAVGLLADPVSVWIAGAVVPVSGGLDYPLNLPRVLAH
jgi:NAD(P)-dependent dehydrogenase (short-subunit alcohol dehydrogenase family)